MIIVIIVRGAIIVCFEPKMQRCRVKSNITIEWEDADGWILMYSGLWALRASSFPPGPRISPRVGAS